eukprot:11204191-Lingulodinium_polyedra.AAC.1
MKAVCHTHHQCTARVNCPGQFAEAEMALFLWGRDGVRRDRVLHQARRYSVQGQMQMLRRRGVAE